MKRFTDWNISTKLQTSFAAVAAIAAFIGWVGLYEVDHMNARSGAMYHDALVPIRDLGYANAALLNARTEVRSMMSEPEREKRKSYVTTIESENAKVEDYIAHYSKTNLSSGEIEQLVSALGFFRTSNSSVSELPLGNRRESLKNLQEALAPTPAASKSGSKSGVAFSMTESNDRIDKEFERF